MANEVKIEISLEEKQALDALTKLIKKTDEFTDSFQKGAKESSRAFDVFAGSLAANLVGKTIDAAADAAKKMFQLFIVDGIKAAQESESALNKLNTALKISGLEVEKTSANLQAFAAELQKTTKFEDDAIIANIALLQSIGNLTERGLKEGTQAATDLSAAMGIDLESAIRMVGKAANGEVASFKKYGIEIKQGTTDSETFANALAVLNSKFGGSAAAQADTYAGRIEQLKNAFGDLQEETGNLIIKNKDISDTINILTKGIVNFTRSLSDGGLQASTFGKALDFLLITPAKFWSDFFFGGKESSGLTGINAQIDQLNKQLEISEKKLKATTGGDGKATFFGGLFGGYDQAREDIGNITAQISELKVKRDAMMGQGGSGFVGPQKPEGGNLKKDPMADVDVIYEQEKQAILFQLREESSLLESENKALALEAEALEGEEKLIKLQEQAAVEADLQKNIDSMKALDLSKNKQDLANISDKFDKENAAKKKASIDAELAMERAKQQAINNIVTSAFTFGAAVLKDGSKEQFLIQKAGALAAIGIADGQARVQAMASTSLIPFPGNLAALATMQSLITANTALGVGTVLAQTIKGFQTGGFVGGNSIAGDQTVIRANSGERVLTMAEQRNMIDTMASGGPSASNKGIQDAINAAFSQPIMVMVDGKEIARATRTALKDGYSI